MLVNVLVEAWQMQCCGPSFADGDHVEWALSAQGDVAWLESLVGDRAAPTVDFTWEKHGPVPEDCLTAKGVVRGIQSLRCGLEPISADDPNMLHPVDGSGRLEVVHSADGWGPSGRGGYDLGFMGYIVTLEVAR